MFQNKNKGFSEAGIQIMKSINLAAAAINGVEFCLQAARLLLTQPKAPIAQLSNHFENANAVAHITPEAMMGLDAVFTASSVGGYLYFKNMLQERRRQTLANEFS